MDEKNILREVKIRPIRKEEFSLWKELMNKYHYLGYKRMPGKNIHYVATLRDRWVALLGWGSAALKCKVRDDFIGWDEKKKLERLFLLANNVRFLIFPWINIKNLASKILSLNLKRLSNDFKLLYGHPVVLVETFVDLSRYKGTCYRAANWIYLGKTKGFSKRNRHYYPNNHPKGVFVYPLFKDAKALLKAELLPYDFNLLYRRDFMEALRNFPIESLISEIGKITDPRKPRGIRHPLVVVLGISVCAVLCGARSFLAIGQWAKGLPKEILKRFGARRDEPPSEPTIRRTIHSIDADEFDRRISNWLISQKCFKGKGLAVDGKVLRGGGLKLLSAIVHKEGIIIKQNEIREGTNEIKAFKPLLKDIEINGAVVTVDAMHCQRENAKFLVEEKGADYVFTVKENQKTLLEDIKDLDFKKNPLIIMK